MTKAKNLKFECQRCGYCCRDFGGSKTLPVFEFEIPGLKYQAKKKKSVLVFVPENIFLDKKSGQIFCLNYGLSNMPCPFLTKNQGVFGCSIYENRPLICRKFPLEKNPLFHEITKESFFDCDNLYADKTLSCVQKENNCLNNKQVEKQFIEIFGKNVWNASLGVDKIKLRINKELKELEVLEKIEPVSVDWIDSKNPEIIGVFEFLDKYKQTKTSVV